MKKTAVVLFIALISIFALTSSVIAGDKMYLIEKGNVKILISSQDETGTADLVVTEMKKTGWESKSIPNTIAETIMKFQVNCTNAETASGGINTKGRWMGSTESYMLLDEEVGEVFQKILAQLYKKATGKTL